MYWSSKRGGVGGRLAEFSRIKLEKTEDSKDHAFQLEKTMLSKQIKGEKADMKKLFEMLCIEA